MLAAETVAGMQRPGAAGMDPAGRVQRRNNNDQEILIMAKGQSLQEPFLNYLRKERIPVSIYLVNGIKLQGQVESFDQFVVLLRNSVSQMIYKHAISTVVPSRPVRLNLGEEGSPAAGSGEQPPRG